jgi:hypothetical protein
MWKLCCHVHFHFYIVILFLTIITQTKDFPFNMVILLNCSPEHGHGFLTLLSPNFLQTFICEHLRIISYVSNSNTFSWKWYIYIYISHFFQYLFWVLHTSDHGRLLLPTDYHRNWWKARTFKAPSTLRSFHFTCTNSGYALRFHFDDKTLSMSGLILLTETKLQQKYLSHEGQAFSNHFITDIHTG